MDINECEINTDNCHKNATCSNNVGSFKCVCDAGFHGNGTNCYDIDECVQNFSHDNQGSFNASNGCHTNAFCSNLIGSYECSCENGYYGDGFNCSDEGSKLYEATFFNKNYFPNFQNYSIVYIKNNLMRISNFGLTY